MCVKRPTCHACRCRHRRQLLQPTLRMLTLSALRVACVPCRLFSRPATFTCSLSTTSACCLATFSAVAPSPTGPAASAAAADAGGRTAPFSCALAAGSVLRAPAATEDAACVALALFGPADASLPLGFEACAGIAAAAGRADGALPSCSTTSVAARPAVAAAEAGSASAASAASSAG